MFWVRVPVCGSCGNVNFHNSLCGILSQQWEVEGKPLGVWKFPSRVRRTFSPLHSSLWLTCSWTLVWLCHELIFSPSVFSHLSGTLSLSTCSSVERICKCSQLNHGVDAVLLDSTAPDYTGFKPDGRKIKHIFIRSINIRCPACCSAWYPTDEKNKEQIWKCVFVVFTATLCNNAFLK